MIKIGKEQKERKGTIEMERKLNDSFLKKELERESFLYFEKGTGISCSMYIVFEVRKSTKKASSALAILDVKNNLSGNPLRALCTVS